MGLPPYMPRCLLLAAPLCLVAGSPERGALLALAAEEVPGEPPGGCSLLQLRSQPVEAGPGSWRPPAGRAAAFVLQLQPRAGEVLDRNASRAAATAAVGEVPGDEAAVLVPLLILLPALAGVLFSLTRPILEVSAEFARYAAEFVGTFVLVFTVACCALAGSATWSPTAIGCVLMVMTYATGPLSGGNLNPAVSLALGMTGDLEWDMVFKYWLAQVTAGLSAAASASAILAPSTFALAPVAPFEGCHAVMAEVLYTFMLCFVFLNCAASKENNSPTDGNQFYALAIGFVAIAGGYAVGTVSGGAFNPAVAVGLDLRHFGLGWGIWYALFELLGAALAATLYSVVRPGERPGAEGPAVYGPELPAKCISEFLGAFMLVMTVGLNVVTASPAAAFSAAAALMCMTYSLGDVSGGHFNPAVTLAVVARGACPPGDGVAYALSQMAAGMLAGLLSAIFHAAGPRHDITYAVQPGAGHGFYAAGFLELFFTAVLAYAVLAVTTVRAPASQVTRQNFYFALSIGACVAAGGFATAAVSGGQLNPAVSAGISAIASMSPGSTPPAAYTYLVGFSILELAGGLCAAIAFRFTHPKELSPDASVEGGSLACEFVGTFVLVFTAGCCAVTGCATWSATAIGSVYVAMVYATGPISGGHLNPAVSLAMALAGKLAWPRCIAYCWAQLLAGALAGASYCALLAPGRSALHPVAPFSFFYAMLAELTYTAMLCFVALSCTASKRNNPPRDGNQFFGLAIGFVIIAGGYAAGGISGATLNPAVALGLDIEHLGFGWGIVWTVAELMGGALGALLYTVTRPDEQMGAADFESYVPRLHTRCVSEFLGAFMLVFTVGLNVVMASPAVAWSAAAALMCMTYSLGGVSGGHFNPAVTLAVVLSGRDKCTPSDGAAYVAAQLCAGALAGLFCRAFHAAGPNSATAYGLKPGAGYNAAAAGACELFFTFVLAYIVLAVATTRPPLSQLTKQSFHFALSIGSCVTAGGVAIRAISGGELNPAVAVGIAAEDLSLGSLLGVAAWELAGGVLAAAVFRVTHPMEFRRLGAEKA